MSSRARHRARLHRPTLRQIIKDIRSQWAHKRYLRRRASL